MLVFEKMCKFRFRATMFVVSVGFLVSAFKRSSSLSYIFHISSSLGSKVEIQPLRKSNLIPQCKQCQAYGHTQRYCNKDTRCAKCAGKHHTKECKKPKEAHPKCVHCGEAHPVNYRGCSVAIQLQKIKTQNMKAKRTSLPQRQSATTQDRRITLLR